MEFRSTNDNGYIHRQGDIVTNVSSGGPINSSHGVHLTGGSTGGIVQAISWVLKEQVRHDRERVLSRDWETYPILTFPEVPKVETVLLNHPDQPPLGSGEASQGPAGAAIANALKHAAGLRLRALPYTPERVKAALERN
jgi:CO/xanthine dehydrogenase Mo-binding subunit